MPFLLALICCWQTDKSSVDGIQVDMVETVTMVSMPLRVRLNGLSYRELELEDLRIVENGVSVQPSQLKRTQAPLTIHYLFDLSISNERLLFQAKRAARNLIQSMRREERAKISFFSRRYQALTEYTANTSDLTRALGRLTPVGSTALYDGVSGAIDELNRVSGLRALVVFSDGHDLISRTVESELLAKVRNYRIPILFAAYPTAKNRGALLDAQVDFMKKLAAVSGGGAVVGSSDYERALARSLKRLRTRYTLVYAPPDPDNLEQWRSVVIRVEGCPRCTLEYRRAYQLKEWAAAGR